MGHIVMIQQGHRRGDQFNVTVHLVRSAQSDVTSVLLMIPILKVSVTFVIVKACCIFYKRIYNCTMLSKKMGGQLDILHSDIHVRR